MNRRKFIQLSSASTAGILFSRLNSFTTTATAPIINPPDAAWVLTDDGWQECAPVNGNSFTYRDITIGINPTATGQAATLHAPTLPVREIRLSWKHQISQQTICLGDHWERTYGDVDWHKPDSNRKEPWYLAIHDPQSTACFGVKTGCNSICSWTLSPTSLDLSLDTRAGGVGVLLGDRVLPLAEIVTTRNSASESPFQTLTRFCTTLCDRPRLPIQPIYGINDWYYAYGNNSPALILEQTKLMGELVSDTANKPFSVIDAGWAKYSPKLPGDCCWQDDFSQPNDKFKSMASLADQIKSAGMRPGLWTRPLCAKSTDPGSLLLPSIPGRDNPLNPILDPTIPENMARIQHNISLYKAWGFEMVKHDFSTFDITGRWGFQMKDQLTPDGWSFATRDKTTAEIINHLYSSIREAAGDMYLLGCNTMSHLAAGQFELNRIGDDTSGKEWSRTRKMGVNTLAFRICQHRSFYYADGDCVGLTKEVPWEKNKQWMQLLAESSTPLFISAQPDALGPAQKAFIKTSFAKAAKPQPIGEPLDWMAETLPKKWKLDDLIVEFDWS